MHGATREAEGSQLMAVGRVPNTGDLGSTAPESKTDARGYITSMTSFKNQCARHLAIGDATGGRVHAHVL